MGPRVGRAGRVASTTSRLARKRSCWLVCRRGPRWWRRTLATPPRLALQLSRKEALAPGRGLGAGALWRMHWRCSTRNRASGAGRTRLRPGAVGGRKRCWLPRPACLGLAACAAQSHFMRRERTTTGRVLPLPQELSLLPSSRRRACTRRGTEELAADQPRELPCGACAGHRPSQRAGGSRMPG